MAFDAFLKISTIPGESTDDKHKDWIEVLRFRLAMRQSSAGQRSTGGAATAGRVNVKPLVVLKLLDKASPKLALACCTGEHIPEVRLQLCRATGDKTPYMEYILNDVIVTQVSRGANNDQELPLPMEEVAFDFGTITWKYTQPDHRTGKPVGEVKAHWDLIANTGA